MDPLKLPPYLRYRPVEIICKTLKNTTQRAKVILHRLMQKHMKPRFPLLNSKRCYEMVSSDRFYANVKDIENGMVCCHVFYGCTMGCINLFGHKTGGDGYYNAYRDFCRNHGIPTILARDNAQEQKSQKVTDFNRDHLVADRFLEVNNQQ